MKPANTNYIPVSLRVYQDESPELYDLLSQLSRSKSTLVRRLCDVAITSEDLQDVDPINILNGTYLYKKHHDTNDSISGVKPLNPSTDNNNPKGHYENLKDVVQLEFED